jgi:hypothetical protein
MKRAVAYSEGVALIAGLAHLPPVERPFAWLGSGPLRPSDAAGGLLDRLQRGGGGGDEDGRAAMQLQILKVREGAGGCICCCGRYTCRVVLSCLTSRGACLSSVWVINTACCLTKIAVTAAHVSAGGTPQPTACPPPCRSRWRSRRRC